MPQKNPLELFHSHTQNWFAAVLGEPTAVQKEAWPSIADGGHTLVSAPTGTGKTLSAFLVFIDRLKEEARAGRLKKELRVIYISPLKSLAGDIRENLHKPLNGIHGEERKQGDEIGMDIHVAIRTGDTSASERRKMLKNPPHILITTPESLYLLLTSLSGREMLKTAQAVIIDELHAMIDTKRGAHLMLSLARLDQLCEKSLQRIGLSATIQPLETAAAYLTGNGSPVKIAAPRMRKDIRIEVVSPVEDFRNLPQGTIWPEIARAVYEQCYGARSVIAFVDGRMYAEKLAYQINLLAGENFARTHHGCVSKEQRHEAERDLRSGALRLLVATSSMELGIDVGDIDRVVQIAYPRSIASVLQRLGRAGHNPGRESVMKIFPRTASEGLYCGLTADAASRGGIEKLHPPRLCFDVLAQHLVSMATGDGYTLDEALPLIRQAYPFREITKEEVQNILSMLAGDFEHMRDLPVRPRILYDRINEKVEGDAYSRMLAVSAGGTIPDTGQFAAKTENGVKIGELDEEFVFEQRVGMKFMLGSFAWKITAMNKDTVTVAPSSPEGANPPFWRHAWLARKWQTGIAFGKRLREMTEASGSSGDTGRSNERNMDGVVAILREMGLDEALAHNTAEIVMRQLEATGVLPDDRTVIAEHFSDEAGDYQLMVHSVFGRQVNAPLAILLQEAASRITGTDISVYEDDDGVLLMSHGKRPLPEKLLYAIQPSASRGVLEAMLPSTPLFNMTFRYNAGRALMMGVRKGKRNPLWVQRLRSAEMLDSVIQFPNHPLIRETKRECTEDYWDLPGLEQVLKGIQNGLIQVRELYRTEASPLSLNLRRAAESHFMYDYFPSMKRINQAAGEALEEAMKIKPAAEQLARASERKKLPENEQQLHSLLMMEGDLTAGELNIPLEWFETLAAAGRVLYIEPGLWIAAEQGALYETAFCEDPEEPEADVQNARINIARRALRYRGAHDGSLLAERYALPADTAEGILRTLLERKEAIEENGLYYHADVYEYARRETLNARRRQVKTRPPHVYAALLSSRLRISAPPAEQLRNALESLNGRAFPPALWENSILPARVNHYRPALLDNLLAGGEWFWQLANDKGQFLLSFHPSGDTDWDFDINPLAAQPESQDTDTKREWRFMAADRDVSMDEEEYKIFDILRKRGASFITALPGTAERPAHDVFISLIEKGVVRADSFVPIRQWLDRGKFDTISVKQRVKAKVLTQTSGRWELSRPLVRLTPEQQLERAFSQTIILCRETAQALGINWTLALEKLRVWEYTGRARRGYFIEGLSGAQFIHEKDYSGAMLAFEYFDMMDKEEWNQTPDEGINLSAAEFSYPDIIWLAASDPLQPWGRLLANPGLNNFICVPGTAVALQLGLPVAIFERYGAVLRIFKEESMLSALKAFKKEYANKHIFPGQKRVAVRQYPPEAAQALEEAGFVKTMMDYIAYSELK